MWWKGRVFQYNNYKCAYARTINGQHIFRFFAGGSTGEMSGIFRRGEVILSGMRFTRTNNWKFAKTFRAPEGDFTVALVEINLGGGVTWRYHPLGGSTLTTRYTREAVDLHESAFSGAKDIIVTGSRMLSSDGAMELVESRVLYSLPDIKATMYAPGAIRREARVYKNGDWYAFHNTESTVVLVNPTGATRLILDFQYKRDGNMLVAPRLLVQGETLAEHGLTFEAQPMHLVGLEEPMHRILILPGEPDRILLQNGPFAYTVVDASTLSTDIYPPDIQYAGTYGVNETWKGHIFTNNGEWVVYYETTEEGDWFVNPIGLQANAVLCRGVYANGTVTVAGRVYSKNGKSTMRTFVTDDGISSVILMDADNQQFYMYPRIGNGWLRLGYSRTVGQLFSAVILGSVNAFLVAGYTSVPGTARYIDTPITKFPDSAGFAQEVRPVRERVYLSPSSDRAIYSVNARYYMVVRGGMPVMICNSAQDECEPIATPEGQLEYQGITYQMSLASNADWYHTGATVSVTEWGTQFTHTGGNGVEYTVTTQPIAAVEEPQLNGPSV